MPADVPEVLRREGLLLDASVRRSPDRLVELLHPDFVEFGASGRVWDRSTIVTALQDDPGVSGTGADLVASGLSDTVVLVTYRVTGKRESLRSSVWVKDTAAGWQLRFHQGTLTG